MPNLKLAFLSVEHLLNDGCLQGTWFANYCANTGMGSMEWAWGVVTFAGKKGGG